MNLAQIIAKAKSDLKNKVNTDTLLLWADQSQTDIYNLDIPLFEKRVTDFVTPDDNILTFLKTDIADDIRKVKEWFYPKDPGATLVDDYNRFTNFSKVYIAFREDDTNVYLQSPVLTTIDATVVYYKSPNTLISIATVPTLPGRWIRGIYLGIMRMAGEHQYKTPQGNWEVLFEQYLNKISDKESVMDKGAGKVDAYNVLRDTNFTRRRRYGY